MKKKQPLREFIPPSLKKTLLIMRIAAFLMILGFLQAYAVETYSQKTKLSLDYLNTELIKVLDNIEVESEFYFLYNEKLLNTNRKVSIDVNEQPIITILDNLFAGTDVKYTIIDRKIILAPDYLTIGTDNNANLQQHTITGRVIDSQTREPMPGVNIVVKGTAMGTVTDIEGRYTFNISDPNSIILVSFIGYIQQEIALAGRRSIDIQMTPSVETLDEVVVTALGIQRDKKTLTYSSQQVAGAEMMKAKDINFMNALSGKTAGLEIKKAASGAGGSTKTLLRGSKSFSGNSAPLYVIDGVPITNRIGGQAGLWGGYDEGDGISQINPDDIESISLLKGANAAILYGSQGANGVVMITTKKGKEGTMDISISNATMFENILAYPELQYKYGAIGDAKESWGVTPLSSYDDTFVKDFFQRGHDIVSNVSISGGNERTTAYFSYANTMSKGIIPENHYRKDNVTLSQSTKVFKDKLTVSSKVMFTSEMAYNRPPNGWYMNTLTGLYWFPRQKDISEYRDGDNWKEWIPDRYMYKMHWHVTDHHQSNPWWITRMQPREDGGKRVIAGVNVTYDISKSLKFTVKGNYDYANKKNEQRHWAGSNTTNVSKNGTWNFREYKDWMSYIDAILSYNKYFGDFSLNTLAGISYQETSYGDGVSVNNGASYPLMLPNEFSLQNMPHTVIVNTTFPSRTIKEGYFANASIGFKEMVFLDLSGRMDRSSTLAFTENGVAYFYPAIGFSGIVSEMVSLPDFVTFGKVRGSYTTVANDVGFDNIIQRMSINNRSVTSQVGSTSVTSSASVSAPTSPDWLTAKPEMITSVEVGTDWRFLDGKVGFDFTYYNIISTDQRMSIPTLQGVGFNSMLINAGKITNKGIELIVDAEPISRGSFSWITSLNYAHNKNKIVVVNPDDVNQIINLGSSEGYYSRIKSGGSFGDLYAFNFEYDDQGRIKLDDNQNPLKTTEPVFVGRIDPDFTLGWNNTFNYKRLSMGFLINGVFGGNVLSYTEAMLDNYGVSKRSADARDKGGVKVNAVMPDGSAVTTVDPEKWYRAIGNINGILGAYVYDRTNVRLTQFSLNYNVPLGNLNLPVKSASVGLVGQNLFFLYRNAPYDPELTMSAGSGSQALDNFNLPSTRTYGFNIKVNF